VEGIRKRLTYANVMATIAVFVALGGASYAAIKLPKNSVGTRQIKKNAITTAKIKNRAVTGAKLRMGTLGTVPSAERAASAANADALGGLPPSAFAGSAQITRGSASLVPATPQTIITLPGGFSLLTQPGDSEKVTMKAAPGAEWTIASETNEVTTLGGSPTIPLTGNLETYVALSPDAPARWAITCYYNFTASTFDCVAVGG